MRPPVKVLLFILSMATGGVFLYSAYTKLIPIQAFEYTLADDAHLPRMLAALAARLFTGLEAALGLLIVSHLFGRKKWVLKAALILVAVFSLYLIYLWITKGNNVELRLFW